MDFIDRVRVGEYYEDCAYHPCLCVMFRALVIDGNLADYDIEGIDLVTGSTPAAQSATLRVTETHSGRSS